MNKRQKVRTIINAFRRSEIGQMRACEEICSILSKDSFWTDDKVIEFVNWYVELHKLGTKYALENQSILDSFKAGDNISEWHKND